MPLWEAYPVGRIERAFALLAFECADAMEELEPSVEAEALAVAGGCALFAGVGSPLTQAHGIGMERPVEDDDIDTIEAFYELRGSASIIDVPECADDSLAERLEEREYERLERKNILIHDLEELDDIPKIEGLTIVRDAGLEWAIATAQGFLPAPGAPPASEVVVFHTYAQCPSMTSYLALIDGEPAAGAAMSVFDEVAIFYSTSTRHEFRGLGIQKALLLQRLLDAIEAGCDLAAVMTAIDSTSQRNVEKMGFRRIYEKQKMIGNL